MPVKRRRGKAFTQAFSEALRRAVLDYAHFVQDMGEPGADYDAKLFAARHAAAKACLAHVAELLDLLGEDAGVDQLRDGFALLHEAQVALGLPQAAEGSPDGGGGVR